MRYIIAGILSLALIGCSINARKDAGEYWQGVVEDQRMQEGVKGNDCHTLDESSSFDVKPKYEESLAKDFEQRDTTMAHANDGKFIDDKVLVRGFEPRPSVTAYVRGNVKPKLKKRFVSDFEPRPSVTSYVSSLKPKDEKSIVREFEPRPSVTSYVSKDEKSFMRDFEPRPSATSYVNKRDFEDEVKPADVKDFEPRPNISAYTDEVKSIDDESYVKEFEPRPNVSAYTDNIKSVDEKSYTKDFEPIPNVSAYTDDVKSKEKGYTKDFEPRPNVSSYNDDVIGSKAQKALEKPRPNAYVRSS